MFSETASAIIDLVWIISVSIGLILTSIEVRRLRKRIKKLEERFGSDEQ